MPSAAVWAQEARPQPDAGEAKKAIKVPIEILKSKHLAVQIKVNDKGPFRVILDTGAPVTIVSNRLAEEAGLLTEKTKKSGLGFFGARLPMKVKKLQVGDAVVENSELMIMDHPLVEFAGKVLGRLDGIVGFPFISQFAATIDYQSEQLTLEPTSYKSGGSYFEMMMSLGLGMMFEDAKPVKKILAPQTLWGFVPSNPNDKKNGIVIDSVMPGTPAAAGGMQSGDRLLVLDGTWTDTVEDCYRAAANVEIGQKVIAKIERNGQTIEVAVTPKVGL